MRTRRLAAAGAILSFGLAGGLTACTDDPPPSKTLGPKYEAVNCPDDVEVLVVPEHQCGFVRPDRTGAVKIFVLSVEPPEPSGLSPVLETGVDLGMTPGYGGLAPIALRTGRRVVIVDLPGTGHSVPSMDCPEVEAVGDPAAGHAAAGLTDAIATCRARVEADGGDPAGVTPERLGEALFDVMTALDVDHWVVMGHGTTAEAGRQLAIAHPDHVDALVLDSTVDDAQPSIATVVDEVAQLCRADRYCLRTYGDPDRAWKRARTRARTDPLDLAGGNVTFDEGTLERAVRWVTAPSALGARLLPALLQEAASGRPGQTLQLYGDTVSVAPPLCVGYVPKCETDQRLVIGTMLSAMCPTVAAEPDWADACAAWGVPASAAPVRPLTGIPTLALFGGLDPYADATAITERLHARVPDAFVVEETSGGHNVLGSECPRSVRNAWLASDVHDPPPDLPCLSDPPDFRNLF